MPLRAVGHGADKYRGGRGALEAAAVHRDRTAWLERPSRRRGRHGEEQIGGDRGHAHHHQSLALGIGADALGELYWLPDELPDALR